MTYLSKNLVLYFCLCLGAAAAHAQYRIDQWTADEGLPQNSVHGIVQTRDGYLWLATVDGLARFDGVRFTVFNKSNSPGIVNNRFTSLFEAANGDLWAGTEESGIVRYHNGRFNYDAMGGGARIFWMGDGDADSDPMILMNDWKVLHFAGGKFAPFNPRIEFFEGVRDAPRKNARLFCGANQVQNSFGCYSNGRWLRFSTAASSFACEACPAVQDQGGNFWFVTDQRELVRVENGKTVRRFNEANGLPKIPLDFVTGAKLSLVSWDGKDSLWLTDLATLRSELLLKVPADAPTLTGDIYPPYAITDDSMFLSSFQDDEGNLWFGTPRGGLYRPRKQIVTAFSRNEGLSDTNVYPIYEDADGTLLVGTTRGLFTFQNGRFEPVKSAENFYVQAIGRDPAGRLVVSDYNDLYVREDDRFVPFLKGQIPKSDSSDSVYAIHADRENQLWIGSKNGLTRFGDGAATTFTTTDGLAGNDVKVIIDARAGGLWIGTYGGLSHLNNGQLTSWTANNGLPSSTVRALYEDAEGALWIGSYDGGLARFKDGKFTHYNSSIGLHNDGAFQILEDERRNFWISSNHGIYRVNKDELNEFADGKRNTISSTAYGKSDGMLNAEANGGRSPAGIKTRDGRLWFPTQDGVAMIDPHEIKINSQPPPVIIESFKIDNELSELPKLTGDIGMTVKPSQNNFEINYTALSFINSETLRFKYKLEGLDEDWIDAGTRRLAYFSHVPPGDYTFRVIAANSDGVWNEQGATLKIVVMPPFYRTWWFLIAAVFVIAASAFWLFRRRVAQINLKHAAELAFSRRLIDAQEQERKRIAAELHDGLGQNLVVIKNRAMLGLRKGDDKERVAKELDSISESASQAIEEVREITNNLRPQLLDRLGLTRSINAMLKKVSGVIEVESEIDSIDNIFSEAQEISVYRIVQESLNNVIKHSSASEARVVIKAFENTVLIRIEDDGAGFDFENLRSKSGFGLVGLKERTELLNGEFSIESKIGEGTKVKVKIPVRNSR